MKKKGKICAVCGKYEFSEVGDVICGVCGWQWDTVQENDPDYERGANQMSLNQAREAYNKGEEVE